MIEPTRGPSAASADAMTGSARLEAELDHTDLLLSQHRASVRAALVEASVAFGKSAEERGAAIELVLRALATDLAAAFVIVYRYEPSPEGTRRWATLGWCHVEPGDYSRFDGVLVRNSESARRVASGEIMRADRSNWTTFDFAYVASLGARVGIVAPIAADGHLYGELRIGLRHTRDLESDEIEMLRAATTTIHRLLTFPSRLAAAPPSIGGPRTPSRPASRPAPRPVSNTNGTNDSIRRAPDALRDFGNLITAIVGYAELMRARTGADEATHILSAARRAAALSSQLLTTATASTPSTDPATTTTTTTTTPTTATTTTPTPATPSTAPDAAASGNGPAHDRRIVVLLVEDEDIVRAFTTRALERRGFDVLVAATPAEALTFASDGRHIDVLVSDVVMPGMSGPELAERFRSLHADAGIVLTSGYPSGHVLPGGQVLAPGEASGPHDIDFLGKPFEASTLVATIRANLARRGIGSGPDR